MGNGTFHPSDFAGIALYSPTPLDLTRELVGQPVGDGLRFAQYATQDEVYLTGSFELINANPDAPTGTFFSVLSAAGGRDVDGLIQSAQLVSMMPLVPEPPLFALLTCGLALLSVYRRGALSGRRTCELTR